MMMEEELRRCLIWMFYGGGLTIFIFEDAVVAVH
jgi:hypothetical protein